MSEPSLAFEGEPRKGVEVIQNGPRLWTGDLGAAARDLGRRWAEEEQASCGGMFAPTEAAARSRLESLLADLGRSMGAEMVAAALARRNELVAAAVKQPEPSSPASSDTDADECICGHGRDEHEVVGSDMVCGYVGCNCNDYEDNETTEEPDHG